jgi:hypothetical protein
MYDSQQWQHGANINTSEHRAQAQVAANSAYRSELLSQEAVIKTSSDAKRTGLDRKQTGLDRQQTEDDKFYAEHYSLVAEHAAGVSKEPSLAEHVASKSKNSSSNDVSHRAQEAASKQAQRKAEIISNATKEFEQSIKNYGDGSQFNWRDLDAANETPGGGSRPEQTDDKSSGRNYGPGPNGEFAGLYTPSPDGKPVAGSFDGGEG